MTSPHKPVRVLFVFLRDAVGAKEEIMEESCHGSQANRCHANIFSSALPNLHQRADRWIGRKAGVDLRLIRMMEHIHDMRAPHTLRVVKTGLIKAARLEISDPG